MYTPILHLPQPGQKLLSGLGTSSPGVSLSWPPACCISNHPKLDVQLLILGVKEHHLSLPHINFAPSSTSTPTDGLDGKGGLVIVRETKGEKAESDSGKEGR